MTLLTMKRLLSFAFFIFSFISISQTNAGSNESVCFGNTPFTLTGFSPAGGTWTGTDVSPTGVFTPTATGAFVLTYTQGGNSDTKTVTVLQPISSFVLNPSSGCSVPHSVFFNDQSTLPDTWLWNFGDGNTSTLQNPVHNYTTGGDFTVTLTVSDTINGCTSVSTDLVSVTQLDAEYMISNPFGCGPLTVTFSDISTVGGSSPIVSWIWDFGDGTTSTQANPIHVYDQPGIYTPELSVTTANGCTDMYSDPNAIQVIGPDVNFGGNLLTSDCAPHTVNFTDSTIFNAPIVAWDWSFGDGNTSNFQNPSNDYLATGSYDVSLTVTDIDGCSRTLTFQDYVVIEDLVPPTITCPSDLTLSTDPGVCSASNPAIGTAITADNCAIASTVNDVPTTIFPGIVIVAWTTTDDSGLTASCNQSITVLDESTTSSITESVCDSYTTPSGVNLSSSVLFTDVIPNATGCDSTISIDLTVNFSSQTNLTDVGCGNYVSASGQTYTNSGTYTELLTSAQGCDSTVTLEITIENLDATISQNETTLTANWTGAESYQWIDCSDNSIIVGATNSTYVTFTNGDFAVIVSSPNCTDTSACATVNSAFLDELNSNPLFLYPNPSSSRETKVFYDGEMIAIDVCDMLGRKVEVPIDLKSGTISTVDLTAGNYFVRVKTDRGVFVLEMMIAEM